MKYLITGGLGFIGGHFVRNLLQKEKDVDITVVDNLSNTDFYSDWVQEFKFSEYGNRFQYFSYDIKDEMEFVKDEQFDYILHFAAQGHVDKSIKDPVRTVQTNVMGTLNILELARKQHNLRKFVYFSTDEVFGPEAISGEVNEYSPYVCTNPYSASKAGGEELVNAYMHTYNIPVLVTHCTNVFGPRQQYGAFIPICIDKILKGETLTIHTAEGDVPERNYIYVDNVVNSIYDLMVLNTGSFNITGEGSVNILTLAHIISKIIGKELRIKFSESARPYTDDNYNVNSDKLKELGINYTSDFDEDLKRTVQFYMEKL